MDQARFPGFAKTDANRPIEVDLFHRSAERRSGMDVPKIATGGGAYRLRFMSLGGHAIYVAHENAGFLRRRAKCLAGILRFANALKCGQACLARGTGLVAVFGLCRPFVRKLCECCI
jgi:hypothetical protein